MMPVQMQGYAPSSWAHGLFACFGDCGVCCTGCWLPCILYAENGKLMRGAVSADGDYWLDFLLYTFLCCLTGCGCVLGIMRRGDIRMKYGLEEKPCIDCCVHCCCHDCALCQEYKELKLKAIVGQAAQAQMQPYPVSYAQPVTGQPVAYSQQPPVQAAPTYPPVSAPPMTKGWNVRFSSRVVYVNLKLVMSYERLVILAADQ